MLPHVLYEIGSLLPVGQFLGHLKPHLNRRRRGQVFLAEVPATFRREWLHRTWGPIWGFPSRCRHLAVIHFPAKFSKKWRSEGRLWARIVFETLRSAFRKLLWRQKSKIWWNFSNFLSGNVYSWTWARTRRVAKSALLDARKRRWNVFLSERRQTSVF